eukprot:TRINITY_DN38056_c0_g1_i1.p1 TRINITY_DN38056_c0_g1~~TRINITY_DN38056_c0_g1_i1.p1  ORF type:complete len:222 (-),score=15.83 TRINITY_DN38056_c0_g1_i1:152-817(-)
MTATRESAAVCALCGSSPDSDDPAGVTMVNKSGLSLCQPCYDAAFEADMSVARVLRFEPADHIVDNIYLGPEGARVDQRWLEQNGIGSVLTVAAHSGHLPRFEGILYKVFDVDDHPSEANTLRQYFQEGKEFMESAARLNPTRSNVLVHCVSGISRSGAMVVAYLMATTGICYDEALAQVREKRPVVSPNSGFQAQLRDYEAELRLGSGPVEMSAVPGEGQ